MSRTPGLSWKVTILCGVLWGVCVTLADTLTQPTGQLDLAPMAYFAFGLLWDWTCTGLVWAAGCKLIVRGRWAALRAVLLLPVALTTTLSTHWISPFATGISRDAISNPMLGTIETADLAVYLLWTNLFYGGLYVIGYLVTRRAAVARARLAGFRLARSEADLKLREARVDAFRGQLQPSMLLTGLTALRDRYAVDTVVGNELFDLLIGFLRAAMPSVRSGFSMLAAEIETVQAYARLRAALERPGAAWRFELPPVIPAIPFPSLILLPALDGIAATLPDHAILTLGLAAAPDATILLVISANRPGQLPEELARRLRGGLSMTFGSAASLSPDTGLPIEVRLRPQPITDGSDAYSQQSNPGGYDDGRPPDPHHRDPATLLRDD